MPTVGAVATALFLLADARTEYVMQFGNLPNNYCQWVRERVSPVGKVVGFRERAGE